MGTYSIQHLLAQLFEAFLIIFCLNCGLYDTVSATEFIDFSLLKVIDNFNTSKINVKFEHQFKLLFRKISISYLYCTLSVLILTAHTDNYVGKTFWCYSWQEICCHVIEKVLKNYFKVTCTIQKTRGTSVIYA